MGRGRKRRREGGERRMRIEDRSEERKRRV